MAISPRIVVLLDVCSPPAIHWLIIAVIVDPLNRTSHRAATHIIQKQGEIVPPFANLDSSGSVVLEVAVSWILDARQHRLPRPVFNGHLPVGAIPVLPHRNLAG